MLVRCPRRRCHRGLGLRVRYHAITIGPVERDDAAVFEWGEPPCAQRVLGDAKRRAKLYEQFDTHVKLAAHLQRVSKTHGRRPGAGSRSGDFIYAGYSAVTETWPAWLSNRVRQLSPRGPSTLAVLDRILLVDFDWRCRWCSTGRWRCEGRTSGDLSLRTRGSTNRASWPATKARAAPFVMTFVYDREAPSRVCWSGTPRASGRRHARVRHA